jgi:hypothetical protein
LSNPSGVHTSPVHPLAVEAPVPAVTPGYLCVARSLSFKIRACHFVGQELEAYSKPVSVALHEVLAEPVLVLSKLIKPPVEPVFVDAFRGDVTQVF